MPTKLVYSIGHSSLPGELFLSHLKRFYIACLVDVRRYPGSRLHPQFRREALQAALARECIEYLHLGDALGGYREVPYEEYMKSEGFRAGIDSLEGRLSRPTAFMCAEKDPGNCHRRFIGEELARRGWTVRHIVDGQLKLLG